MSAALPDNIWSSIKSKQTHLSLIFSGRTIGRDFFSHLFKLISEVDSSQNLLVSLKHGLKDMDIPLAVLKVWKLKYMLLLLR